MKIILCFNKNMYISKTILFFLISSFFIIFSEAKEYMVESQGKRVIVKEHIYSDKDNFKVFKLEGTFKDNAGNFGEFNGIVTANTIDNKIHKLEASNEFIYNDKVKAYNIAVRTNDELKQGVGKWYYTYASSSINSLIQSECNYSITYYKDKFLTLAKCDISEEAFDQINRIK